jgi:hypothetical protein
MPYVTGYAKVRVWVPPQVGGGGPPDWGIDEGFPPGVGIPGFPDQGLPGEPEYPGQGLPPGSPGRPGQGLPRPPRGAYPILPDPEDMAGHPPLPDLNAPGRWVQVTPGKSLHRYPAWVVYGEPPEVDEDYAPRHPHNGRPGTWVVIYYGAELCWAWVPSVEGEPGQGLPDEEEHPEVDPDRR